MRGVIESRARSRRLTAVFAKRPDPGRVKTRLVPPLSDGQAAELAAAMLADELERCGACDAFRTAVAHAPADAGPWFAQRFPDVEAIPQVGFGLAARLEAFFERALAPGAAGTAVVLGADAPLLDVPQVAAAHARLEAGADVVLGPDGSDGYWLVGLARPWPALFREVEMSSAGMFARTVALARDAGLEVELVGEELDVDTAPDLARLARACARLDRADPRFPARTAAVLAALPAEVRAALDAAADAGAPAGAGEAAQ